MGSRLNSPILLGQIHRNSFFCYSHVSGSEKFDIPPLDLSDIATDIE
jgi:hypothetical protein